MDTDEHPLSGPSPEPEHSPERLPDGAEPAAPESPEIAAEAETAAVPAPTQNRPKFRRARRQKTPPAAVAVSVLRGPRRINSKAVLPWRRHALPLAGLLLCVGCLWALLAGGPLPAWRLAWLDPAVPSGGVAVIIDPGHGGGDSGAVAQGVVEKSLNLDVGLRVARALRARGLGVRLTREDDHFVPLEDRVQMANRLPGAVFVSIHFNDASGNGQATARASGIETYYCDRKLVPAGGADAWQWAGLLGGAQAGTAARNVESPAVREGQRLADCIQGALIAGTAAADRGTKERSLYVTHRVLAPAVLVEGGFVSHPAEARRLGDPDYRQTLAEAIAEGIVKYLQGGGV